MICLTLILFQPCCFTNDSFFCCSLLIVKINKPIPIPANRNVRRNGRWPWRRTAIARPTIRALLEWMHAWVGVFSCPNSMADRILYKLIAGFTTTVIIIFESPKSFLIYNVFLQKLKITSLLWMIIRI